MEAVVVIAVVFYAVLAIFIGSVSERRGKGFALGFWLSVLTSPVIALLVIIALGNENAGHSINSGSLAASKWQELNDTTDPIKLSAFVEAFPGSEEAFLASQRKQQLDQWRKSDPTDAESLARFVFNPEYAWLSGEIRATIASNSSASANLAKLNEELQRQDAQEEIERREAEKKAAEQLAENERLRQVKEQQDLLSYEKNVRFVAVVAVLLLVGFGAVYFVPRLFDYWATKNALARASQNHVQKLAECTQLERAADDAASRDQMQNSELAREIDAKQLDLRELEFKFKEKFEAKKLALMTEATKNIRLTIRKSPVSFGYIATVYNGSPYCVANLAGIPMDLYNGSAYVDRVQFEELYPWWAFDKELDRDGYEKPCIASSGNAAESHNPLSLAGATTRFINLSSNVQYRASIDPTEFASVLTELRSEKQGSSVKWYAKPVDWDALATANLKDDKYVLDDLTAELSKLKSQLDESEERRAFLAAQNRLKICRQEELNLEQELSSLEK